MDKLRKKNLFVEINNDKLLVAVGEYDEELNFKILDKKIFLSAGFQNGKIINLEICGDDLKKIINEIENKSNIFFSDVNVIINHTNIDCINVSGFKKLNGNQILSQDISYILNDIKSKLVETENCKSIIHLFNTKFLLDNKHIKNLPIGLYGDFYSHQLTFYMIHNNELKNLKALFNKCNLNLKKIILKSFTDGIKVINKKKNDTFIKIIFNKEDTQLMFFEDSSFSFFQKFNFGSDIILKDISKVCSLNLSNVRNIISNSNFKISDKNMYVDKHYFNQNEFRKISLKHIIEISASRIEEIVNIVFNQNKNLYNGHSEEIDVYFDFKDENIKHKFKDIFKSYFKKCKFNFDNSIDEDPFTSIKIFGELLSKGWTKEAIPVLTKKSSWISRIFSGLFE